MFPELYDLAQMLISAREAAGKKSAIVSVFALKEALVANVRWLDDVNFHPVERRRGDQPDPLGHYECYSDTESMWEAPETWVALITYGDDLNWCERRFVWCKELMHIFDTEDGQVKTPEQYRGLLTEIEMRPIGPSESYLSENTAKWMALLILCPKEQRDRMMAEKKEKGLTDYDVALSFRIPQGVVSSLFSRYYDEYYDRFVTKAR